MEATISNALFLLLIGMITVFSILALIILCGRLLISIVNKWFPLAEEKAGHSSPINKQTMDVLQATINKITNSKGIIDKVEKLN